MQNKTDKKTASRRRARRAGMLAMLISTLLTPAGTIVAGAAVTAALVGSVVVGTALDVPDESKPQRPAAKARPSQAASPATAGPDVIPIEHDGQTLIVALTEPAPYALPPASPPPGFAFPGHTGGAPGAPTEPAPRRPLAPMPMPPEAAPSPLPPQAPAGPNGPGRPEVNVLPPPTTTNSRDPEIPREPPPDMPPPPESREPSGPSVNTVPRETVTPDTFAGMPHGGGAGRHAIPEPSIWGLVLLGGAALALARRRPAPAADPA
ncbi:hypothetical protein Tbd_0275 [Thiobacillus denitrificans ATCC 25259]|uniref:PEP-CTERM protein-sorting domain-containing protein n=1 Tax=Thiobacillus denitrificans (strain ATCC 25259 / T1) TaxID=292415 RepID=Q3SM22_THIDA|nr:PEP-CTERM sorting domain-containing protein [Thiobacillus denitrificans]AAZ96228.1 hypothetical protein Tbd_0275 [Thiobacillus denitrificans ATCC 25259]